MSDSSSRKPNRTLSSIDNTNSGNTTSSVHVNGEERNSSITLNALRNGPLQNISSNDISQAIVKQAQALHQAAALLQQHHNDQPVVMAKKSNVVQPLNKNNSPNASKMVQLNLVNENGVVTPIEVNASVAAAAALVAAQKHQNQRIEGVSINNFNTAAINSITNAGPSFGSSPKQADFGSKSTKVLPNSSDGSTANVSNYSFLNS